MEQTIYREIVGYPQYRVGSDGSVWSHWSGRWKPLKLLLETCGYWRVNLYEGGKMKNHQVHLLVLVAFRGSRPVGMEACHSNGKCQDNRLQNLRWDTKANNVADQYLHGTTNQGEKNGHARLTEQQVREIRNTKMRPDLISDFARQHGVSRQTIVRVVKGITWRATLEERMGA